MQYDVIIIGGGQAGAMTAITLRKQKFLGSILLISNEDNLPYQRPPLSKNFLAGLITMQSLYIKSLSYYEKNHIDILMNEVVTLIDRNTQNIILGSGGKHSYQKLVIATGSKLNTLDINCDKEGIYYLKTINDSIKIRSLLEEQQKIVIIGAGYIGLEIAATASKKNDQVIVLEADNRTMSRSVCPETSHFFEAIHKKEGVKFFFNALIKDIHKHNNKKTVILNNDESIDADAIIIGVGIKPRIDLAIESGLDCQNGITVNEYCQTSDNNIFAIGDCANYYNSIYGQRLRLESVQNAIEQALIAASTINEKELPNSQVPWFWSDQYNNKLRIAGISDNYDNYVVRRNMSEEKFAVYYLKQEYLIAVETVNDNKSFSLGKKLIKNNICIPTKALEDKESDLHNWLG